MAFWCAAHLFVHDGKKLSGADYNSKQVDDNDVGDGPSLMVVVAALVVMAIKLIFYYMW